MAPETPELLCERVTKTYASRRGEVVALAGVSLTVGEGEFVCIVGPSGCGKSTLLRIAAGLDVPTSGVVAYAQSDTGRPRNAMVFQEHGLFPWMKLVDNVAFGLEMQGRPAGPRRGEATALLGQLGLGKFAGHYPHELSVGMRQRGAIARALLTDPDVLLMDEPFSALDAQSRLVLQEELLRLCRDRGKTVLFVTHDIDEAVLLGDRVIVMSGRPGRIVDEIRVPLGRQRDLHDRERPELNELKWRIWEAIESDVRKSA